MAFADIKRMAPKKIKVSELYRNPYHYDPRKRVRLKIFYDAFESLINKLLFDTNWTDEELSETRYFDYLFNVAYGIEKGRPSRRRIIDIIKDGIALFHSIKENGIRDPVTMKYINKRWVLEKGYRRIVIAHHLGIEEVRWIPEPKL